MTGYHYARGERERARLYVQVHACTHIHIQCTHAYICTNTHIRVYTQIYINTHIYVFLVPSYPAVASILSILLGELFGLLKDRSLLKWGHSPCTVLQPIFPSLPPKLHHCQGPLLLIVHPCNNGQNATKSMGISWQHFLCNVIAITWKILILNMSLKATETYLDCKLFIFFS